MVFTWLGYFCECGRKESSHPPPMTNDDTSSQVLLPPVRQGRNCCFPMIPATFQLLLFSLLLSLCSCLYVPGSLKGLPAIPLSNNNGDGTTVDIDDLINSKKGSSLVVFGTYAADFNMIEYAQRLTHYIPRLKEKDISNFVMIVNSSPAAAEKLAKLLEIPSEIDMLCDPTGTISKKFGVNTGWRPDDADMSPYVKLFGMLWGLGAWATLPSVIGGYLGNPFTSQGWIEEALAQGQRQGRFPTNALNLDDNGRVLLNKFSELPLVGSWPRRPLELATLRLQNMMGISLANWSDLKPNDEELKAGVLTQLGGCLVLSENGDVRYEWRDQGICHVVNFEDMIAKL